MRHSLLLRLLGLSLAVAVFAIGATAWLTSRDTSERFRGEFERTLEADTYIYGQLTAYASRNDAWSDVDGLVAELAERTGRRVALTSLDGDLLADSAAAPGQAGPGLATNPTAEINASAAQMRSAEATHIGYEGDSFTALSADPLEALPYHYAGLTAPGQIAYSSAISSGTSPVWRMTGDEASTRRWLATEAEACLRDTFDTDDELVVTPTGEVLVIGEDYAELMVGDRGLEDAGTSDRVVSLSSLALGDRVGEPHPCLPAELFEPSEAALEFNIREVALMGDCLEAAGAPYAVVDTSGGLQSVMPERDQGSDSVMSNDMHLEWMECEQRAWSETMEEFVAEPALLYTGDSGRFNPFFGDGWSRTVLAGAAVLAVAGGVTVLGGRRLTRPIRELTTATDRMGAGEHGVRVRTGGRDEVAQLASAFNSMAESLEANETQRRAMVSDIAHELRTPLANVRGYLEAAEDGVVPLDATLVTSLLEESALLQRLIDDLQDLALADAGMLRVHPEPRDASDLVRQAVAAHRAGADDAGVALIADLDVDIAADAELDVVDGAELAAADDSAGSTPTIVSVDPERLRQALGNLVSNAVRFTPAGGTVTASVRVDGASVILAVADDGPGIPPEHLPRVFDRFYRVEESRSRETGGSGLGLAITKHLVEAHQGTVDVHSVEGEGSVFTIRLPAHRPAPVG